LTLFLPLVWSAEATIPKTARFRKSIFSLSMRDSTVQSSTEMSVQYESSRKIGGEEFVDLLRRSTLAERRPVDDLQAINAMIEHANLICTAWDGPKLVGVARSVTDFVYCCYLSDLAVDVAYQRQGVGRELIRLTRSKLGKRAMIALLSAPKAEGYYPRIGFDAHRSAWILPATGNLK
jgi:predicted N-acetyltransferase YhbS